MVRGYKHDVFALAGAIFAFVDYTSLVSDR
jgi:hypothetical protein